MDKEKQNATFASWLEIQINPIYESISNRAYNTIDKSQLPREAFLWVEDPENRETWHLPYRDGTGEIDPSTGFYTQVGAVNLNALRAIAQVLTQSKNTPLKIPPEIRSKTIKLLKRYKIGEYADESEESKMDGIDIYESMVPEQFTGAELDETNMVVHNVAVLRPTSRNKKFSGSKGRRYSQLARESVSTLMAGKKAYINHATKKELQERGGVRDIKDTLGYWGDVAHIDESGIVRNDLHFLENHREWFVPMVKQMPDKVGVSIHAFGDMVFNEGEQMEDVNDITLVDSVDLVSEPGSTHNLLESYTEKENTLETKDFTLEELRENRPDLIAAIETELKTKLDEKGELVTLREQVGTLTIKNRDLAIQLDEANIKEKARTKNEQINKLLSDSKLSPEFITDTFRESLGTCEGEKQMTDLIEDRKKIVGSAKKVTGMGDEQDLDESVQKKDVDDDSFLAIFNKELK